MERRSFAFAFAVAFTLTFAGAVDPGGRTHAFAG